MSRVLFRSRLGEIPLPRAVFQEVTRCSDILIMRKISTTLKRQLLLPRKLSQLGPGISWFDVNGDSHDDLLIGSGKGGELAVYLGAARTDSNATPPRL